MITPDTKDWTWVLDRPCPECGFDASTCPAEEVAALVRQNSLAWQDLRRDGAIRRGRPNEETWSSLEYACHVRDMFVRFGARIALMLSEDDPLFENWDQDATALTDRYERQAPEVVVATLTTAAEAVARQLDQISGAQWDRPGRRSDGASFSVASLVRYMVHDQIHHAWDVASARS